MKEFSSSQSISTKLGNTGMKNSVATSTIPNMKNRASMARRSELTLGRGGSVLTKGPKSRAGEPPHTRPAGTATPSARADWPSRCASLPMDVLPSRMQ